MKKILLAVSIAVLLGFVSFIVYDKYVFKHDVDIESLVTFKITGEEGRVTYEKVIQPGLPLEVVSFLNELEFDYAPVLGARHNSTIEVSYHYDEKLLSAYRIKVNPENDGMLSVEVGHLDYYVRSLDDYPDALKTRVYELLLPKIEAVRQGIRDEIKCASCAITITQEDDPIVLDTWYHVDVTVLEARLLKYRYQVSVNGTTGYFDQYLLVFNQNIHVKENEVIEIAEEDSTVLTLAFSSNLQPKSDQQVIDDFRAVLNKVYIE